MAVNPILRGENGVSLTGVGRATEMGPQTLGPSAKGAIEYTGERMLPEYSDENTFWEHINRYRFAAKWAKGKRVLDIASGEGYGSRGLLGAGARSVIGVDIDESACRHAAQKYQIDARVGSAEAIPVETGSIDVAVSFETIEHVPNPARFVQEILRVLASDGLLVISTPDKNLYSPPGKDPNPYHCSEMTREDFQALLHANFPTISFFGQRPFAARWWNPISLISETSAWDRLGPTAKLRRRLWSKWNPQRVAPLSETDRQRPVDCILDGKRSLLERATNWSAVRPLSQSSSWRPVFLVAVARKKK
jgi:SAM-dependent methyltransferase